jgi:hypothetical protein
MQHKLASRYIPACPSHVPQVYYAHMADTPQADVHLADGSDVLIGVRVHRTYPEDGSRRSGKRRGPVLTIKKLTDFRTKDGRTIANGMAVLHDAKKNHPAGTEPVWQLRRAQGHQPRAPGLRDTRSLPRVSVKGDGDRTTMARSSVSSIRIENDLRERLKARGREFSNVMRREVIRLYDLLDESRERLVFPHGTLSVLAEAWALAAPPPGQELKPQWFVPVLLNAVRRIGTPEASTLIAYVQTWSPLDALAVQDIVERFAPETSGADHLVGLGLKECPPDEAGSPESPVRARGRN